MADDRFLAAANKPAEEAMRLHPFFKGKIQIHRDRVDIETQQHRFADKWRVCQESNADNIRGGIDDALNGADVCIAFSSPGPDVIRPEWVRAMARDAIVFACANPVPEIWPWQAKEAGAKVVATGQ